MVAMANKEPSTPGGRLCKKLVEQFGEIVTEAHREAIADGLSFDDYNSAVTAAFEIQLCKVLASRSLVPLGETALELPLLPGRLELAQAMIGEQLRHAVGAFFQVCRIINQKVAAKRNP